MSRETKECSFTGEGRASSLAAYAGLLVQDVASAPWIVAILRKTDGLVVAGNPAAHRWIARIPEVVPDACRLQDMLADEEPEARMRRMLQQVCASGAWSGSLLLRDGSAAVDACASLSGVPDDKEGYLCLRAATLGLMRGDRSEIGARASDSELLNALLSTLPESIYFKDLDGRFLRVSDFMARRFGFEDGSALKGRSDFDLHPGEHARHLFEEDRAVLASQTPLRDEEKQEALVDGSIAWVSDSRYPLYDSEGSLAGTFGISRDITDRKREEQQRREMELQMQLSQKLESIGRLASGVAHEINTPAQFITDNTQFLQRAMLPVFATLDAYRELRDAVRSGGDVAAALDKVANTEKAMRVDYFLREIPQTLEDTLEGLTRVTRIVRSLKEFSHPNQSAKAPVDLNRAIETTLALSRHEWKYVAETRLDLQPNLPLVPCVLDEINQVLLNLIVNAAHAIEDARKQDSSKGKGLITVSTRAEGNTATIEVSDTGTGIPDEVKAHLFEPFFTTKEVGRGTGQGLAIIRSVIVKSHGGSVFFETEVGKGTKFTVCLPLAEPGAESEA